MALTIVQWNWSYDDKVFVTNYMILNTAQYPVVATVADRLGYGLLLFLSVAVSMAYLPMMEGAQVAGMALAELWHRLIVAVFGLLLFMSLIGEKPEITPFFKTLGALFALVLLVWLALGAFFHVKDFGEEVRMIFIPLCAVWVGWRMKLDERRLRLLAGMFTIGVVIVGLAVVFMQGSGFSITEYFSDQKNTLGPMLATAAVLCMGVVINAKGKTALPMVLLGLALAALCVLLILTIRARAALLAVAMVLSLMLFWRFKSRYTLLSLWVAILLVIAVFIILPHSMKQYVYQSLFSGFTVGDISSGRMARNYQAMSIWAQNPLFGQLVNAKEIGVVHNYPLWQLFRFGLLGALPMLLIYVFLFVKDVKELFALRTVSVMSVGFYALLIGFVVSFFEYTFPFGPGTSTVVGFIFFGVALKSSSKTENTSDVNLSMDNNNGI